MPSLSISQSPPHFWSLTNKCYHESKSKTRRVQLISSFTYSPKNLSICKPPAQISRRSRNCSRYARSESGDLNSYGSSSSSSGRKDDGLVDLPLFPLPLVLFPGAVLPLQIFEYRYRILMQTLLQTDQRFGIVYSGGKEMGRGRAAAVGCVGEIIKHEKLPDDRFFLICQGQERFRVVDIKRNKPYLVGRVAWLEDRPSLAGLDLGLGLDDSQGGSQEALANEVEGLLKDVIRLSNKMSGRGGESGSEEAPPDLRKSAFPTPFSFWVASTFEGAPNEQQALLELEDTSERLRRERETLKNTLNYLTAATAVKDVFASGPES